MSPLQAHPTNVVRRSKAAMLASGRTGSTIYPATVKPDLGHLVTCSAVAVSGWGAYIGADGVSGRVRVDAGYE